MRIGIIDADLLDNGTRHPNLALMKISGYYKDQLHDVKLILSYNEDLSDYDKIFMSKVFSFTKVPSRVLALPNVEVGGTGFFYENAPDLPEYIEHHKPDYSLYEDFVNGKIEDGHPRSRYADYLDYSIGFTTRGCFRKCEFCVNKKYSHAFRHSSVKEFYDEDRPFIYLWDDNFLAYPRWNEILDELEETGKPFQFRQGIDLRLMTDEKAKRLYHSKYQGDFIFAFDHLKDRDVIVEKVQLWKRHSSKICKMYVLCAFESQDEKDIEDTFERIRVLMQYGSLPYIMRHENYRNSRFKSMYIELARWCNQPQFLKKKSFREFCIANQEYKKNKETNCSGYQAMLDFEKEFPQIAKKYFDLKFEQENIYKRQYGYGRRYANKPNCSHCKKKGMCWDALLSDPQRRSEMIEKYLTKEIDLQCLTYQNRECEIDAERAARLLVDVLLDTEIESLVDLLLYASEREAVTVENIPQYSDLATALYLVPEVLGRVEGEISYAEMGQYLLGGEKNENADKKYGENHSKLAALLDLAVISKESISASVWQSVLGKVFVKLREEEKDNLLPKLCYRIPIIQNAIIHADPSEAIETDMSILAMSTRKRRSANVYDLLAFAQNN